jgi:hypothetical protein
MPHARARALLAGAVVGMTGLAAAGCGVDQAQLVEAKLQQYAHAVAGRDAPMLCAQVLAPQLIAVLQQQTGLSCRQAMTTYVDSVTDPTLSVSKVTVSGQHAAAVVLAGARGQTAALGTIHLTHGSGGWRIASLTQTG